MAAAAELAADFADVHLVVFRAQADARHFWFDFLEHAGDDHRLNGTEVVNQAFGVVALRAGAGEIFFLQPKPRDPVVVACVFEEIEPEMTRLSLRSKNPQVNVSEICGQFGGGGHPAAAGARIPGKPLSVQRKVIAAVKRALMAVK